MARVVKLTSIMKLTISPDMIKGVISLLTDRRSLFGVCLLLFDDGS